MPELRRSVRGWLSGTGCDCSETTKCRKIEIGPPQTWASPTPGFCAGQEGGGDFSGRVEPAEASEQPLRIWCARPTARPTGRSSEAPSIRAIRTTRSGPADALESQNNTHLHTHTGTEHRENTERRRGWHARRPPAARPRPRRTRATRGRAQAPRRREAMLRFGRARVPMTCLLPCLIQITPRTRGEEGFCATRSPKPLGRMPQGRARRRG